MELAHDTNNHLSTINWTFNSHANNSSWYWKWHFPYWNFPYCQNPLTKMKLFYKYVYKLYYLLCLPHSYFPLQFRGHSRKTSETAWKLNIIIVIIHSRYSEYFLFPEISFITVADYISGEFSSGFSTKITSRYWWRVLWEI